VEEKSSRRTELRTIPARGLLLVKVVEHKSSSGIFLTSAALNQKIRVGEVVEVGELELLQSGGVVDLPHVRPGVQVLFGVSEVHPTLPGHEFVQFRHIVGILVDD